MSRVKLQKGQQERFLNRIAKYFYFDWSKIAKMSSVCERTLRDWRREKYNMSYEVLLKLHKISGISLPKSVEVLPECWSTKKAGLIGALKCYELYGNPGTLEGRRKGGIISQQKFQMRPDYAKRLGFKVRKEIKYPKKSSLLAEFIGILLGDGGISKYQVYITFNRETDKEHAHFIQKIIQNLFSISSFIVSGGAIDKGDNIVIASKNLIEFLRRLGLQQGNKVKNKVDIPDWIMKNKAYAIPCLRGLIDTDGSFYQYRHRVNGKYYVNFSMCFTNHSLPLLKSTYNILKIMSFDPIMSNDNRIYLHKKNEIDRYFKEIGTNNSKHLSKFNNYLRYRRDVRVA